MSATTPSSPGVWVHAATHPGAVRTANEDAMGASGWSAAGTTSLISHHYPADELVLCVVADGLGGHNAGEIASALAVDSLVHQPSPGNVEELTQAVAATHTRISDAAESTASHAGMATTAVVLVITADTILCANVGDSRIYELAAGELIRTSYDDKPERPGEDTSALLSQALGGHRRAQPDSHPQWFVREPGLSFLLCSDGVTNVISDDELATTLSSAPSAGAGVERLIACCLERGASDNVTAMLVLIDHDGTAPRHLHHPTPEPRG